MVNKHGVSRRQFTEADVKHFKSAALRTITNITTSSYGKLKKKNSFTGVFQRFCS